MDKQINVTIFNEFLHEKEERRTNGVVKFNLNNPDELEMCIVGNDVTMGETTVVKVPDEFYLEEQECFIRTVLGEDLPYYPDINDGIAAQKILDAAIKSAGCGKVVEL